jgi:hypothetical protein
MRAFALAIAWTAVATGVLAATSAAAQDRGRLPPGVVGYVTADSRFSGQSVRAPVRRGPQGRLEVRLPGGTWIECGQNCSDTLRRQTVDFWRNHGGRDGGGDGPGYLNFRW